MSIVRACMYFAYRRIRTGLARLPDGVVARTGRFREHGSARGAGAGDSGVRVERDGTAGVGGDHQTVVGFRDRRARVGRNAKA